uniref:Putative portal protein n=1 Tax=viral metagenome TaxID=1070528 RepID=A0A6M3IYC5_9ZZZZ
MPPVIFGNFMDSKRANLQAAPDYPYEYPFNKNLNPKSEFHRRLLGMILARVNESARVMQYRFKSWNAIEEVLTVYTPLDKDEKAVQAKDRRKPVSLIVPASYAVLETLLTYFMAAFLEEPYFRYKGVDESGHDAIGAKLLEKVVHIQAIRNKIALGMHTMWRDSFIHGLGIAVPGWRVKTGIQPTKVMQRTWDNDARKYFETPTGEYEEKKVVLAEGSTLKNIDPYMYLPDPNVPPHEVQEGEFVGWVTRTNVYKMLMEEKIAMDLGMFNAQYLKHMGTAKSSYFRLNESMRDKERRGGEQGFAYMSPVDNIETYVTLIPNDWGLNNRDEPEIWWFRVSGDAVITGAKPLGLWHQMYPVAICAPDFDGYTTAPLSRLEIVQPMQHTLNWFISSHIANVRRSISDRLVYDPYVINSNDVENPDAGVAIRVRKAAWGRGKIKDSISQLDVMDVTRNHVGDAAYFFGEIQKITAAVDSVLGIERKTGERVTAAEFQGRSSNAISRLASAAKIASIMAHQDLGLMFAMHTQQMMSKTAYVNIVGDDEKLLRSTYGIAGDIAAVNPQDVRLFVDVIPHDGTVPGDENAAVWVQLYQTMALNPELMKLFDMVRVFQHLARQLGAKSLHEFVKKPETAVNAQVLPNEDVMDLVRSGDIAPVGAETGGGNGEF